MKRSTQNITPLDTLILDLVHQMLRIYFQSRTWNGIAFWFNSLRFVGTNLFLAWYFNAYFLKLFCFFDVFKFVLEKSK